MNLNLQLKSKTFPMFLMAMLSVWGYGQTPYQMSSGNYSESFSDIGNWNNGFAAGTGAQHWKGLAVNSSGVIPDGIKTTKASTTFSTGTTGGIQKGTGALVFLSTGSAVNGEAVATDLYLDFTNRVAGNLSFDWTATDNSSGTRPTSLRIYWSIDGTTFTELTSAQTLEKVSPSTGSINVALPVQFNSAPSAIIRFYNHAGSSAGSGARDRIQIDNLAITSTAGNTPTLYTANSTSLTDFSEVFGSPSVDVRSFTTNAENLTDNLIITPPANWEISLTQNSGFSNSPISLVPSNNLVAATNIYVRISNTAFIGAQSGNITLTSTGATSKTIAVAGEVKIAAPTAFNATNVSGNTFTANWSLVTGAMNYFLDVYTLNPTIVTEGFANAPTAPTGWSFTGVSNYASGGVAGPSLKFDDTGDKIVSPLYNNSVKELNFWILGNGTNSTSPSSLLVEGYNGTSWVTIDTISPIATTGANYTYNANTAIVLPNNIVQFRFTYTKNAGNISFDDFTITENQKVYIPGLQNLMLPGITNFLVGGLTPGVEYFYNVRASNGIVTSANSNTIAVTTLADTTWNGTAWSNGIPTTVTNANIEGDYSTATLPAFSAKNIAIRNGSTLEITSGNTISANNVSVAVGSNFIQRDGSILQNSGLFTITKLGSSLVDKYTFWSSPVESQNLSNIYLPFSTPTFITEYNSATDYFVNAASTTAVFAKGYSIKTPTSNAIVNFSGVPNNGTQTYTLSTLGNGFNLVGNPYPSQLNLSAFYNANSGRISNTFYFWDNTSNSVAVQGGASTTNVGYATYNALTQVWVPAPNISVIPTVNTASIAQGFMVKTLPSTVDTSLSFTNDMRVSGSGISFNRTNPTDEGKYWLRLNSAYNTNNTLAVVYKNSASNSFDMYDSKAIGLGSDAFYSIADAQKLVIQGKTSFNVSDVVPVGAKYFQNGNFEIALAQKEGLFNNGQAIYLHDKELNTYTNLQTNNYSFSANAGEFSNRFEIVYQLGNLATTEAIKDTFEVYKSNDEIFVRNSSNIDNVEVFDASGRKIMSLKPNSNIVNLKIESKGLYIIKATSEGKEFSKKIIK